MSKNKTHKEKRGELKGITPTTVIVDESQVVGTIETTVIPPELQEHTPMQSPSIATRLISKEDLDEAYAKGFKDGKLSADIELRQLREFNPAHNEKTISVVEQSDGNWKAIGQRFGKLIEVRAGKPEDCLVILLTHDGK